MATTQHQLEVRQLILIVHSTKDIAGVNIATSIHRKLHFVETGKTYQENPVYKAEISGKQIIHVTLKEEAVAAQNLSGAFPDSQLIVFISRHSSQSGKPTLSVHAPGNLGTAELGGLPRQVSKASACSMQIALKSLSRQKTERNLNYEVSYECTHHGPSLSIPTMFVELGSSEEQWKDEVASEVVGNAALEAISRFDKSGEAVLGIGGTHYNQKFTQMALTDKTAFGHMIPKHALPTVDQKIIQHCIERTQEKVVTAILDWKGIKSEDKHKLLVLLQNIGLKIKKV